MDFFFLIVFLTIYYIRPHEWIDWVGSMRPISLTIVLALASLLFRERGIRFRDFIRTPHDRLMLLYFFWICVSSDEPFETLGACYALLVFYFLVVQIAYDPERLKGFIKWWALMIFSIAFLAWASEMGFDPTESYRRTHGARLQGRLILNTSLFDNPNALGHSVVPILGILYLYHVWKHGIFRIILGIVLAIIPIWTIYLTQSKGTYLSGFVMVLCMLTFRKSLIQKLATVGGMLIIGSILLTALPRMEDLTRDKGDREEGIEGRIASWTFALDCLQNNRVLGYSKFAPTFHETFGYQKPSHSSYVQIGAELSYPGLFCFVGLMYICVRSLHEVKTKDIELERIRRILFVMLAAYAASSWTVDFAFRATFFMLVGAVAALHRLNLPPDDKPPVVNPELLTEPKTPITEIFTRLRFIDFPVMVGLTYLTVRLWIFLKNSV